MKRFFHSGGAAIVVLISIAVGICLDRLIINVHQKVYHPFMKRDFYDLDDNLKIGSSRQHALKVLGPPSVVADSYDELHGEAYPIGQPKGEEIMLYSEYPWGILVFVDKKQQRVSRLMLVRHY